MAQKWTRIAVFTSFGLAALGLSVAPANSADDKVGEKVPPIKAIMKAGHKGDDAAMAKVTLAVKDGKWEEAQKFAKLLADNGAVLGKNSPRKGDAKSWESLTEKYADTTKALYAATEKKDADGTKAALESLGASCKMCHMAHRGK